MRLVVLASGRGSNFEAIAKAVRSGEIPNSEIVTLVTNNPNANAVQIAKTFGIRCSIIDSQSHIRDGKLDRNAYDKKLGEILSQLKPDFVCLAGYMLILGSDLVRTWKNRIINIHPSLLPSFPGLRAQFQALQSGVRFTGCTVHFVTKEVDSGPILEQSKVEILPTDTEESLIARLLPIEHQTYIRALKKLSTTEWRIDGNSCIWG